jgi:hypothetical protein
MVLTVSFVLSSVTGLVCHRRLADDSAKLDASVGASGPHDFAVRVSAVRLWRHPRPPHPAAYVRDDRETPLCLGRDDFALFLFLPNGKAKNFCRRDWTRNSENSPPGKSAIVGWAKGAIAPCPPSIGSLVLNGGHAEFIIGRAFARPVGFAHPTLLSRASRAMTALVNLRSAGSAAARSPGTAAALRSARHVLTAPGNARPRTGRDAPRR